MQELEESVWQEFNKTYAKALDYDVSKLELSSDDNTVLDVFFRKFLDVNENFPEGSRHTIIEKNFAIYILKNKINIEEIKIAYKNKGFNVNSLISQLKGVEAGTYKGNVSVGELVNWCKANRPDLVQIFQDLKSLDETKVIRRSDLVFPTSHIPLFEDIDKATQIFGDEYNHAKKLLAYHFVSCSLPLNLIGVTRGQITIDLRDYLFFVYPSGKAKGNMVNVDTIVNSRLNKKVAQIMSLHEEQLIGKIIKRKEKDPNNSKKMKEVYIANYGYMASNELIFDECRSLLQSKETEISRKYLLKGMDKYPFNLVSKKSVDNLDVDEEKISYNPLFNSLYLTQPFNFSEDEIVLNGFLKRVSIDYIPIVEITEDIFETRLKTVRDNSINYDNLISNLNKISITNQSKWTFEDGFNETFITCFKDLRNAGLYNTRKKRNYTKIIEWQLQDRLLRKSCLLAIMRSGKPHVTCEDVDIAFVDLLEDLVIELEFVNDKVYGSLDYGSVWGTSDKKEESILKYLAQFNALSEETSTVTISELQQEIRNVYKVKEEQARKIYYKLVNRELIKSGQVGKTGTKVWLINAPKFEGGNIGKGGNGFKAKYYQLIDKYNLKGGNNRRVVIDSSSKLHKKEVLNE